MDHGVGNQFGGGIDKWLMAMWQVVNDRNGISYYEVSRMVLDAHPPMGKTGV